MSDKQADVSKNDARWADLRRKLIVRPTLAGFGTVVADCATCDPLLDYEGCVVVNLMPQYALAYNSSAGSEVAYSMRRDGQGRIQYETSDPSTIGT